MTTAVVLLFRKRCASLLLRSIVGYAAAASLLVPTSATANDSTAEMATGGLRLAHSTAIEMISEDLTISVDHIRVAYVFINRTDHSISVPVAFPLPDLKQDADEDATVPTDDPINPFAFALKINGVRTAVMLERRAIVGGVDHAADLISLGVPVVPTSSRTRAALDALPMAARIRLITAHVVSVATSEGTEPSRQHLQPNWTLRSTYYWIQVFPAGRKVAVEHDYQPSVGASAQTEIGLPHWRSDRRYARYASDYCPDADLVTTVTQAMRRRNIDYPPFAEQRIDYVLHTGGNWRGPIGRFHLTVDKGEPDALMSVCMDGLTKTSPTRFELTRTDFLPVGDLRILLLIPQ